MTTTQTRPRGRPRLPDDERRRDLTVRMHPAKRAAYEAAATREGLTLTTWLESAADARLARPDYARIVRAALDDSVARARLATIVVPVMPDDVETMLVRVERMAEQTGRSSSAWRGIVEMIENATREETP